MSDRDNITLPRELVLHLEAMLVCFSVTQSHRDQRQAREAITALRARLAAPSEDIDALRRDAERLKAERDEQLRGLLLDIRKDSQSSHWHRDIDASMDALTALVSSALDAWTAPAAAAVDASKEPATEPAIRAQEQEDKR